MSYSLFKTMLAGRRYFEGREKSNDDYLPVKKHLIKFHGWNDNQFGSQRNPYQLDVGPGLEPSITLHPSMEKAGGVAPIRTALSDVLQRGSSIRFNPSGLRLASLKFIPFFWRKALDKICWRNFVIEHLSTVQELPDATPRRDGDVLNYRDLFGCWWTISAFEDFEFSAVNFSLDLKMVFPTVVLIEPDYVNIRRATLDDLENLNSFENSAAELKVRTLGNLGETVKEFLDGLSGDR